MMPLLFVIFCTAFHTTAESSASFEAAGHVSRAACIQNQQQAFTTLQPHLQSLRYVPGLPLIGKDGHMISTWKVYGPTAVKPIFEQYRTLHETLLTKIITHAVGEGAIIGVIFACLNKALSTDEFDKKTLALGILATCCAVLLRYQTTTPCPFLDDRLTVRENIFDIHRGITEGIVALTSAALSYFGTHRALERTLNS